MSPPVALVTGASRGIGRAIALALGQQHWHVTVNYQTNHAAAESVVRAIRKAGGQAVAIQGDIASAPARDALVDQTLSAFGRIDLLVNNAGMAPPVRADLLEATEASFDCLLAVNLKGPYFLTQRVANVMLEQCRAPAQAVADPAALPYAPRIIMISSISAYAASVNRGDYCIAKAGLAMVTTLYAARLAEAGINVYEIRPGIIATDMTGPVKATYDRLIAEGLTPIPRWGRPEDVAQAVMAIANDLLPFSTGQVLNVDGGFHLRRL